ncbi:MAG: hypothetical protein IJS16_08915 [Butyrivibrio sp.]|nr:hypothetical protein [Butyrivibrio sp.]
MSKYQEVMDHIKVDDEMKKRILQNVEKKLEEAPQEVVTPKPKVVPFKRYAAIAATFTVLLVGSYAVMQATGGIGGTNSSTSVYEPVMEDAASMGEEPAYEAEDSAAEAPAAEPSMDKAEGAVEAPAEHDVIMQPVMNEAQPNASVSANMEPIVPIVLTAVIAIFILVVVIIFVRKRKR